MQGEIIAIGDELISGRVLNETSGFIANRLFSAGYRIARITTVGDDPDAIGDALLSALENSRFIIVTGGLGPTSDDITTEVAAMVLGLPLKTNEDLLSRLRQNSHRWGKTPREMIEKLSLLPDGAQVLEPGGSVSGFLIDHEGVNVFFLPGVPEQAERLLVGSVLPRLHTAISPGFLVRQRVYKVFGLNETEINAAIMGLDDSDGISIGYYPVFPEVHVTVTSRDQNHTTVETTLANVCKRLESSLGRNIVATDDDTIETVLGRLLTKRKAMLATAESCTGGLVASRITKIPGSSEWFERGVITYSNRAKSEILGIPEDTIRLHGAVSRETAIGMAEGIKSLSRADYALAITGIAGPAGGSPEKPVGTVYIAMAMPQKTACERFLFPGGRQKIQILTAETALDWLRLHLKHDTFIPGYRPSGGNNC